MRWLLILLLFTVNTSALTQKNLVFASINHPTVIDYYEPLLRSIYAELGINLDFVYISGERSEVSLQSGLIDGALAYSEANLASVENMIVVEPPLITVKQYLLCQQGLDCTPSVLEDPENTIFMASVVKKSQNLEIKASIETMTSITVLEKLFTHNRIKYMIYPFSSERNDVNLVFAKAERFFLYEEKGFHVLNIKHKELEEKVQKQLIKKLKD